MSKVVGTDFQIRPEAAVDSPEISNLLDEAFDGRYESELVERLRSTPCYVAELTLVAEQRSEIVGFIMLSYVTLDNGDAKSDVLALGPVAVVPKEQKSGIGSALIREAIKLANAREEKLIVLLGHETYYPRFGFERASLWGIRPPVEWNDNSFMILKLDGYHQNLKNLKNLKGTIRYCDAWQIE